MDVYRDGKKLPNYDVEHDDIFVHPNGVHIRTEGDEYAFWSFTWDQVVDHMRNAARAGGQPAVPLQEPTRANLEDWFAFKAKVENETGYTLQLEPLADKANRSYGYVRQEHGRYKAEHGENT